MIKKQKNALVNFSKLGYRYFRMCLNIQKKDRERVLEYLSLHPNVCWVLEGDGWFNIGAGIWVKNNTELNNISEQVRKFIGTRNEVVTQSELTELFAFEQSSNIRNNICLLDSDLSFKELSPLELDYIKLVTFNSDTTVEETAKILNVDVKYLNEIKNNLEKEGVIVGYGPHDNWDGYYYKIFVDSSSLKDNFNIDEFIEDLWKDKNCIYFARANSKYNIEFEIIVKNKNELKKYTKEFKEYKQVLFSKNHYTNLYPFNKTANLREIKAVLDSQAGEKVVDLRNSKIWYMNYGSAEAYIDIFEKNKKYAKTMMNGEVSLFKNISKYLKENYKSNFYKLIDIGSGNGVKAKYFIHAIGGENIKSYYPTDIQPIELDIAEKNNQTEKFKINKTLINIENISSVFPLKDLPGEKQIYIFFWWYIWQFYFRKNK